MSKTIRTPKEIAKKLNLSKDAVRTMEKISLGRVIGISEYQISLIDPNDPNDPIARMFIPSEDELSLEGDLSSCNERGNLVLPGVQHKYGETAVVLTTSKCAAFCRFCFRKRVTLENKGKGCDEILDDVDGMVRYVKKHPEISNVLVTGGDPLTLPLGKLKNIIEPLTEIEHLDFIRIGSRLFASDPDRVTDRLLKVLCKYSERKKILLVTHFNHPKELSERAVSAVHRAQKFGFQVYCQTVFLKGVNDNTDTLVNLFRGLTRIGVTPYYIFQCRPVKGTAHFSVPFVRGFKIIQEVRSRLGGPAKLFNFSATHETGKIEIIDVVETGDGNALMKLKHHQRKNSKIPSGCFEIIIEAKAYWLPRDLGF